MIRMMDMRKGFPSTAARVAVLAMLLPGAIAWGYVEAPFPLGKIVAQSQTIVLMRVEKVNREKNLIVFQKVRDLKGRHPEPTIKHDIGRRGFHEREWKNIMAWAQPGRMAVFFYTGGASETYIDKYWYQTTKGAWWRMTHAEPFLLRSFAGRPLKLAAIVTEMLAGREVVVPCMRDGDKKALQLRTARLQRMKASLRIQDYNPKRDFAGWGAEEFAPVAGMGGFTHLASLDRLGPGVSGVATTDLNADGRPDLCLFGAGRLSLLKNEGGVLNPVDLPLVGGARAAAWSDHNRTGRPDLLLATPTGPRLLQNHGKSFEDITAGLPRQGYYNVTAAAWIDYDHDKKPDILLADGFRGLRLYRNLGVVLAAPRKPIIGPWYYIGPFDNTGGRGFDVVHPPEQGIDFSKSYRGKDGETACWSAGNFPDGKVNDLRLFRPGNGENAVVYLYREFDFARAAELPVSLAGDDTLTVWLNGKKVFSRKTPLGATPGQARLKLRLLPGKNTLLVKVCQGGGGWAFHFAAGKATTIVPPLFEDVSDKVGLGTAGVGGAAKGYHLAVADVNGDGTDDVLYSAGQSAAPILAINKAGRFVLAAGSGLSYRPGRGAPAFGDFNGDGRVDLFVPQRGTSKLFRGDGRGRFTDVTAASGALAKLSAYATCGAWADFARTGRADLFIGCIKGPNRYLRNNGDGTFTDATERIGLHQWVFNTRGLAVMDINKDGMLDVVFNNDGQRSVALLGNPAWPALLAAARK